jgi:hypothetical protein
MSFSSEEKSNKTEAFMHHKNIKVLIRKQLKKQYPQWKRLNHAAKREISKKVLAEVTAEYDFNQIISCSKAELLGIEQQVSTKGMIKLDEMARYIELFRTSNIFHLNRYQRSPLYIKDEELRFIDELIDDRLINGILSTPGYSPAMRDLFPSTLLRAELLKAIKYPEISYRKFCSEEYLGLDRKQNRVFCGLPLNRKEMIDHTRLSKFRSGLSFVQQVNLLVYFLHHFHQSGLLGDTVVHAVDSTELASDFCKRPLATVKINGKKIRIYNDLDCDCGKRRNKRDKSAYVIGYRLHTLTAIDATTGHSYPLVSLLAPANHHDSHFLPFLVNLAQAMGVTLQLITADEAYHDNDGSLFEKTGVLLTTPPSAMAKPPAHIDAATGAVFCDDTCTIAMQHLGVADGNHEYRCGAERCECDRSGVCPQYRFIPVDRGLFQRIPFHTNRLEEALAIRKNCERSFNLLKNQTGLETVRVRSQRATLARCSLGSIAVLLIKMAGTRRQHSVKSPQQLSIWQEKKAA